MKTFLSVDDLDPHVVLEFMSFLRVPIDTKPGDLNLLCLQGVSPDGDGLRLNQNKVNVYDDTILPVFFLSKATLDRLKVTEGCGITKFLGTVDPGSYYKDRPGGQAHLTFGHHRYVQGLHAGKPAFRALNELNRVWRDQDKDFNPTAKDYVETGKFGVNIHPGGQTEYINNWSAGCINVHGGWEGPNWKTLMGLAEDHFKGNGSLGVTVWRGKDLCGFLESKWDYRPTLSLGTLNPWVGDLQRLLARKKFYAKAIDSDWGLNTDSAVRMFQTAVGLPSTGIVDTDTWKALER